MISQGKSVLTFPLGLLLKRKLTSVSMSTYFLATRELILVAVSHCNRTLLWLARPPEVIQ